MESHLEKTNITEENRNKLFIEFQEKKLFSTYKNTFGSLVSGSSANRFLENQYENEGIGKEKKSRRKIFREFLQDKL